MSKGIRPGVVRKTIAAVFVVFACAWLLRPSVLASGEHRGEVYVLTLDSAAFDAPPGVPNALVHVPEELDADRPFRVVLFLHDWGTCVEALTGGQPVRCREGEPLTQAWSVPARHRVVLDETGDSQSVLVVPALAYDGDEGSSGRFAEPGFGEALLTEALRQVGLAVGSELPPITLAVSGVGYEVALRLIEQGDVPLRDIVLLDALYAGNGTFLRWLAGGPDRRVVTVYSEGGFTRLNSRFLLYRGLFRIPPQQARSAEWAEGMGDLRLAVLGSPHPPREVARAHLADVLIFLYGSPSGD